MNDLTLKQLQDEHRTWCVYNFGPLNAEFAMLGMQEELGELAHSVLKQKQNIRGTSEQHEAAGKDAIGDLLVYLVNFASARGWDVQEIIQQVWDEVKVRDWKKFPKNGMTE